MRDTKHKSIRYEKFLPDKRVSRVTCFICTELVSLPNKMFKNQNKCAHPFCVECMIKYINSKLDYGLHRIKCPVLKCAQFLDPISCRADLPSLVFDRWINLLCEFAVLRIDRCYCPYKECSALILNECGGSRLRKSECPNCKNLFCFSCRVAWHAGHICKEVRKLSDWDDIADGVLAENKKWQRCPACHHCVERISGCNYVTCRCGTLFCYKCGKKVKDHWHGCSIDYVDILDILRCILLALVVSLPVVLFVLDII